MKYNIFFGVSSFFIVLVILIYHCMQYSKNTELNKKFRILVELVLLSNLLDVVSAITISYYQYVPVWLNMVLNTTYFMVSIFLAYMLTEYVRTAIKSDTRRSFFYYMNQIILIIYMGSMILNMFGGYYIWFDHEGAYQHGTLYRLLFICPLYYVGYSALYLLKNRNNLSKRQVYSVGAYVFLTLAGILAQSFLFPDVLLTGFAASIALLVVLFSLETPDYQKLINTLKELEAAKTEAESEKKRADLANLAKTRFLANISHEVRTPINVIIGMNEMILRESNEEKTRQYALDVKKSAHSLLDLINEILDASKMEAGKMEIIPVEYAFDKMLYELLELAGRWAKEKQLELKTDIMHTLPSILYGDEKRIRQVLGNLLSNAMKYTNEGTVKLVVNGIVKEDTVNLHFELNDSGIGIKQEDLARIFNAFERIEDVQSKAIEGTGLGINIAEQILELMGSRLIVESEYGKGSSFSFDLVQKVVSTKQIGDLTTLRKENQYSYETLFCAPDVKVLVVDDSKINLKVFCNLLKKTQVQITAVESGRECLQLITQNHYDIIFLDHMMPDLDGMETIKLMGEMQNNLCMDTPIVMLTANAMTGARDIYLKAGFDDFLSKPISPTQLEKMIYDYVVKK